MLLRDNRELRLIPRYLDLLIFLIERRHQAVHRRDIFDGVWAEVIVSRGSHAEAVAFDPCHGRRADCGYVTVATGRDYADVAPTSGSYIGACPGRLTASRRVGILSAA